MAKDDDTHESDQTPNDSWRERHNAGKVPGTPRRKSRGGLGVIDPRDPFTDVPPYTLGQLPRIYEDFMVDACAAWGGDLGAYASAFLSVIAGVLHASVKMNTNPDKPSVLRNPNDFSFTMGRTGDNKSGLLRDLTRRQTQWHVDSSRTRTGPKRGKGDMGPCVMLQRASVEGALAQIADNRGERLIVVTEEGMGFFKSAGAHRGSEGGAAVNDFIIASYDGGPYVKRLVGRAWNIPECLGTLTTVGIFEEMAGWESFEQFVHSGAASRITMGLMAHTQPRDSARQIEGAEQRMQALLDKLHALRHVHFRMSSEAAQRWAAFVKNKEAGNVRMLEEGESEGLVAWSRKYDMRIVSMAVAFQAIEFVLGGGVDCTQTQVDLPPTQDNKLGESYQLRTVAISEASLVAAAKFVEGYLFDVQRVFYERAAGVTEFYGELLNFMAYRVTTDDPDDPQCREITRDEITHNGPRRLRGAITPARKEAHNRWVQALLDHGFIDVDREHPSLRNLKVPRRDCEERRFRVRAEFIEFFQRDKEALMKHYEASRMVEQKHGPARGVQI